MASSTHTGALYDAISYTGGVGSSSRRDCSGIQTPDSSPQGSPEPNFGGVHHSASKTEPRAAVTATATATAAYKNGGHGTCLGSLPTPEMSPMDQEDAVASTTAEEQQNQQQRQGAVFQLVHKFSSASAFLRSVSHPYRPTMIAASGHDANPSLYSMQFFNGSSGSSDGADVAGANSGAAASYYSPSYTCQDGSFSQAEAFALDRTAYNLPVYSHAGRDLTKCEPSG